MREVLNTIRGNSLWFPDRTAIILLDAQITYRELWQNISVAYTKIRSLQLDHERPVVLLIDQPIRHICVRLALMCTGYGVAAIRPEQIPLVSTLGAQAFFHDAPIKSAPKMRMISVDDEWLTGDWNEIEFDVRLRGSRVGNITFTSGSTGVPKPIARTFRGLQHRIQSGRIPYDRTLILYGLSSNGMSYVLRSLVSGLTAGFSPFDEAIQFVSAQSFSNVACSPQTARSLIKIAEASGVAPKLERMILGSAPLSKKLEEEIRETFSCNLIHLYNASEAGYVAAAQGALLAERGTRGNCFAPIADIEIVDDEGAPLPNGSVGRIKIFSDSVSRVFDGSMEISRDSDANQSFISNDVGRIDPDGVLVLLGRSDELINIGGAKFSPEVPEDIIKGHPMIIDAGIVLVSPKDSHQELWLGVVVKTGFNADFLLGWYSQKTFGELASVTFDRVLLLDEVPRAANGKLLRQKLREKMLALNE